MVFERNKVATVTVGINPFPPWATNGTKVFILNPASCPTRYLRLVFPTGQTYAILGLFRWGCKYHGVMFICLFLPTFKARKYLDTVDYFDIDFHFLPFIFGWNESTLGTMDRMLFMANPASLA